MSALSVGLPRHRILSGVLVVAACVLVGTHGEAAAADPVPRIIDEVVATVGATPILESDLTLARLVRLAGEADGEPPAGRSDLVQARVRLELQYRDIEKSGALFRLQLDASGVQERLVRRAGGRTSLENALAPAGLTWDDVEDLALRVAAANAFVEQRLRPRVRVSLQELRTTYQETVALELSARGSNPPPFEQIRDQIYALLVERKLNEEIERWLALARERLEVTVLRP